MTKKKTTLTIDDGILEKAKAMGINMSETLGEALEHKLGAKGEKTIATDKDGNLVVDAEFTEFLEELKIAFEKYFRSVTYKYKRQWARSWLNARLDSDGFEITKEQKESLLLSLEETMKEGLVEQWSRPKLEIGDEKIKEMKETDYTNFLKYITMLLERDGNNVNPTNLYDWIKARSKKYAGYYSNVSMYRDFLLRYVEETKTKGESRLPVEEWLRIVEVHTPKEKQLNGSCMD